MFLMKNCLYEIKLSKLVNDGSDYLAFYKVDYICGSCGATYRTNPGKCNVCGSSDIRERETDLWPIGSISSAHIVEHGGRG
jgi:rubrerythrin